MFRNNWLVCGLIVRWLATAPFWLPRLTYEAQAPPKVNFPARFAARNPWQDLCRNAADNSTVENRYPIGREIHASRFADSAPPVTMQCRWMCWAKSCPQVCSEATMPICAPNSRSPSG